MGGIDRECYGRYRIDRRIRASLSSKNAWTHSRYCDRLLARGKDKDCDTGPSYCVFLATNMLGRSFFAQSFRYRKDIRQLCASVCRKKMGTKQSVTAVEAKRFGLFVFENRSDIQACEENRLTDLTAGFPGSWERIADKPFSIHGEKSEGKAGACLFHGRKPWNPGFFYVTRQKYGETYDESYKIVEFLGGY